MEARSEATDRILAAFLKLVAERGIEATTTRAVAEEAGVNEVTIFRNFKNKTSLVREAYRRYVPVDSITAYPLALDISSPSRAEAGLVDCLRFLRDSLRHSPQLLLAGIAEYWRHREVEAELSSYPIAARNLLERALTQAAPVLRPEVEPGPTALSLLGLVVITVAWSYRGWLSLDEEEWDAMLAKAVRPLIQANSDRR